MRAERPSTASLYSLSPHSPSRSQITVMGLLSIRLRALYLLLAAEGGVRDRPYFIPPNAKEGEVGEDRGRESKRFHSSEGFLLRPGEAHGLWGLKVGDPGEAGGSKADSERVLWNRGSVERSISAADMRKLVSERLPFFRSRALKVSLLVLDLRRARWMEPGWRGKEEEPRPRELPVGVTGGELG